MSIERETSYISERDSVQQVEAKTRSFLLERKWRSNICTNCNEEYYSKIQVGRLICNKYDCVGYEFLNKPAKKSYITPVQLRETVLNKFSELGFDKVPPMPIVNLKGSTLFTGACGQVFDEAIFYEGVVNTQPMVLAQPVVRLQGKDLVGQVDGFSSSFINIATERANLPTEEHLRYFDKWLDVLSDLGIFMGDISLHLESSFDRWGALVVPTLTLKMNYLGLEIGVSNYFVNVPQKSRAPFTISDISFGLERISWALDKSPSYYDVIGPLMMAARGEFVRMDRFRTLTLLASSNVIPSNKDRGSKFRLLSKQVAVMSETFPTELIKYYYNWWANFHKPPLTLEETVEVIRTEYNRNINLQIQRKLHGDEKIPTNIDIEEYLGYLIQGGIDINDIKKLLGNN